MYELISSLFWGENWDSVHVFHIESDGSSGSKISREVVKKTLDNCGQRPGQRIIMGFENHCCHDFTDRIYAIMGDADLKKINGFYFAVKRRRQAVQIARKMHDVSLGEVEIYGADPDYFFSLVPLMCRSRRRIEKYILNLKVDFTIRGRIKHIIKKLLISIGLSWPLYERFIVVVNHIGKSSNLTVGLNCDDLKAMGH